MNDVINELCATITERKENPVEGSYTAYLFEQGIDKILKKCGEECSEVIIAAKNGEKDRIVSEYGDLVYHLCVLGIECGITPADVAAELEKRSEKKGNLKKFHTVDKNS